MTARRWMVRHLAVFGLAVLSLARVAPAVAGASTTAPPYTDPSAVGYIGLCDQAGQQITSGTVNTTPFAWRAVSSEPAKAPYNNAWRTAILVAYLPLQELPPGDWSGQQLTASSRYSNPTHPMVAATDADSSLEDFIEAFPPKWDGFIELRMFLGTQNEPAYQEQYPVLNIQVTGDTWHAVGGGPVSCSSGTSESIESILLPAATTTPPSSSAASTGSSPAASKTSVGGDGAGTSGSTTSSGARAAHPGAESNAGTGTSGTTPAKQKGVPGGTSSEAGLIAVVAAVAVVVAAVVYLLTRRRRMRHRTVSVPGSPDDPSPRTVDAPEPTSLASESGIAPTSANGHMIPESASTHSSTRKGE